MRFDVCFRTKNIMSVTTCTTIIETKWLSPSHYHKYHEVSEPKISASKYMYYYYCCSDLPNISYYQFCRHFLNYLATSLLCELSFQCLQLTLDHTHPLVVTKHWQYGCKQHESSHSQSFFDQTDHELCHYVGRGPMGLLTLYPCLLQM